MFQIQSWLIPVTFQTEMIFTDIVPIRKLYKLQLWLIVLFLFSGTQVDGDGDRSVNGTYTGSIVNGVAGGRYHILCSLNLPLWF